MILAQMMWYYFFCVISFSPCRFYGELTKMVNIAEEMLPHTQTRPQALSRVQNQMYFLNEILLRAVSFFFFVCFHGNRKMAKPIEVQFHNIYEVKHRKLVPVRGFYPDGSHLKVWLAKVQRIIGCYFTCMVQLRIICNLRLQNTALNRTHRSVLSFHWSLRYNFHFQPQIQNSPSDIFMIIF